MKIVSWNINGIRSGEKKFLEFIKNFSPDILMVQEVRADPDELSLFLKLIPKFQVFFNPSKRPGWSGTAVYYKTSFEFDEISRLSNNEILDSEGRMIFMRIKDIYLFNFYTPNGSTGEERLKFKLKYYDEIFKHMRKLIKMNFKIIIGGDLNVAYQDIDVHEKLLYPVRSSILPEERAWFKKMLGLGFIDTFRIFEKEGGHYSWWHMRDLKRRKNRGIRFDYFLVTKNLKKKVKGAEIKKEVFGSDHCPVVLDIKV